MPENSTAFWNTTSHCKPASTQAWTTSTAKETADAPFSYAVYDSQELCHRTSGPKDNPATNWANSRHRALNLFACIEHRFNQDWKLKAEYDYTRSRFRQPYGVAGVLSIDHNTAATRPDSRLLSTPYLRTHSASVSLIGNTACSAANTI